MSDSPAISTKSETAGTSGRKTSYMNFHFLRLDAGYHRLLPNERVVAKQEFLSAFDSMQDRMPLASYALTGLSGDCDMLLWRVSDRLQDFHAMSSRLQGIGLGKYLLPVRSLLGVVADGSRYALEEAPPSKRAEAPKSLGHAPYLVLQASRSAAALTLPPSDKFPRLHVHCAESSGLDGHDLIVAVEAPDPMEAARYFALWKPPQPPERVCAYTGILGSMRDIIDSFG